MEPELLPGTEATKLFEDKTPNAIILNRILLNSLNVAAHDDLVDADVPARQQAGDGGEAPRPRGCRRCALTRGADLWAR